MSPVLSHVVCAMAFALFSPTSINAETVLWEDNFDSAVPSSPNEQWWSYDLGDGGWGNNELQEYTQNQNNALVSGDTLKIVARRQGNDFTSARIKTQGKVEVKYGTVQARIKVPNVMGGLWPAFWTLGYNFPVVPWPDCGELDIMEVGQGSAGALINNRVVSAAHYLRGDDEIASEAGSHDYMTSFLYEDFHIYSLEWTPELLVTYIDGIEIWRMNITLSECPSCQELHQRHFLLLNMAVGGGFTGPGCGSSSSSSSSSSSGGCQAPTREDINATFPATMEVDYVKIIDNGYTEVFVPSVPPTASPTSAPTLAPTIPRAFQQIQTTAPTVAPTEYPTFSPTEDHDDYYDDYYDDGWKGGKSKGGTLCDGKGKSSKGGKMSGGKMSGSKSGGKMSSKGGGKMSSKSGKSKSDSDCGSSSSFRTTESQLGSSARGLSPAWMSFVLLLPGLFWAF